MIENAIPKIGVHGSRCQCLRSRRVITQLCAERLAAGGHRAAPSVVGAGRAVRCRKTSSRVGRRSRTSSNSSPAASRARTAAVSAAAAAVAPASTVTCAAAPGRRCRRARRAAAPGRRAADAVTITRSPPSRPLSSVGRALGDHPAGAHHGDPVGELVGLVEVLRGQQHRRTGRRPPGGRSARPRCARAGPGRWWARRGRAAAVGGSGRPRCRVGGASRRSRSTTLRSAASAGRTRRAARRRGLARSAFERSCRRPNMTRFSRPKSTSSSAAAWPTSPIDGPHLRAGRGVRRGLRRAPRRRRSG